MTKISERLLSALCATCLVFFVCAAAPTGASATPEHPSGMDALALAPKDSAELEAEPSPVLANDPGVRTSPQEHVLPRLSQSFPAASPPLTGRGSRNVVGVILPLTGKWESIGQKILKGIETAANVFTAGEAPNVEYQIRDYGNNEEAIPGIIDELDREHGVVAVIGPVGERSGEIACREAQQRRLPAIILTQAERPPLEGTYCFRNFLTIDIQARTLLNAARGMGITRFAVMYPDDFFGRIFSAAFQRMAPSFGIKVVRTVMYSPKNVDFKQQVQSLSGTGRKGSSKAQKSLGRGGAFEGLLIPDSAENAAMIASYISYLNLPNIRLFGPTLWDTPEFLRVGDKYVENAVFLSGFFPGSLLSSVQNFSRSFTDTFSYPPSVWEASAFDSASILQEALQSQSLSRQALRERIAAIKAYRGTSGITSFSSDGSLDKIPYILTVKGGTVFEIHP